VFSILLLNLCLFLFIFVVVGTLGDTLVYEIWKENPLKVIFQVKVQETNKVVITNAFAEMVGPSAGSKL